MFSNNNHCSDRLILYLFCMLAIIRGKNIEYQFLKFCNKKKKHKKLKKGLICRISRILVTLTVLYFTSSVHHLLTNISIFSIQYLFNLYISDYYIFDWTIRFIHTYYIYTIIIYIKLFIGYLTRCYCVFVCLYVLLVCRL